MILLPTVLALGLLTLAGCGLGHIAKPWRRTIGILRPIDAIVVTVAAGLVWGASSLMAAGSLMAVIGVPIGWPTLVGFCIACGGLLLWPLARPSSVSRPSIRGFDKVLLGVAALALVVVGWVWFRAATLHPNQTFDSIAIWGTKSRALVYAHGIDHPVFKSPTYSYVHQDYPIGVPVLEAFVAALGVPLARGAIGLLATLPVAASLVLYGALRTRGHTLLAVGMPVVFLAFPLLQRNIGWGYADGIVASFVLVVAVCVWCWLDGGGIGWAFCATAAGVGLVHAKAEGTALLLAMAVGSIISLMLDRAKVARPWGTAAAVWSVPLLSLVPWHTWVHFHDIGTSFLGSGNWRTLPSHGADMVKVLAAGGHFVVDRRGSFAWVWPVAGVVALIRIVCRGREQPFFLFSFLVAAAVFVMINSLAADYLIAVSLDRNLLELSSLVIVWVAAGASAAVRPVMSTPSGPP